MKKITSFSFSDIKISVEKIKNIKKVFWFLGLHIFFVILILVFLDVLFGGILIYKYAILPKTQETNIGDNKFKFDKAAYQEILTELNAREEKFKVASGGDYANPFRSRNIITTGQ